jgi:diadenosine tetraphosphate (Ap4A) HIT family hydrolase
MVQVQNDVNPFLSSIIYEPEIASNDLFKLVCDAHPVVPGHLLMFAKQEARCLADITSSELKKFLSEVIRNELKSDHYLFERGHVKFCSSFSNIIHAHAHIIPDIFGSQVDFSRFGMKKTSTTLELALNAIPTNCEYLLWGKIGGAFSFIVNTNGLPKRLIRNTLAELKTVNYTDETLW